MGERFFSRDFQSPWLGLRSAFSRCRQCRARTTDHAFKVRCNMQRLKSRTTFFASCLLSLFSLTLSTSDGSAAARIAIRQPQPVTVGAWNIQWLGSASKRPGHARNVAKSPQGTSANNPTIFRGSSGGFTIEWTTSDITARRSSGPSTVVFRARAAVGGGLRRA